MKKILSLILLTLLTNCASKSYVGSISTATASGAACFAYISENPVVVATCAVAGSFTGADFMDRESDDQLMTRAFVDHLDNAPSKPGFTTWMNPKTKSNGLIKTTGFYLKGPIKCTNVEVTSNMNLDFTRFFDSILVGNPYRHIQYYEACKMPDGRWRVDE